MEFVEGERARMIDTGRPARVRAIANEMEQDGGVASPGRYNALAVLLADATLSRDDATLRAGQEGLQRLYAQIRGSSASSGEHAELRGRVLSLLDTVSWTLRRLTPVSVLTRFDRGTAARQLLEAIAAEPGLTEVELGDRLSWEAEDVDVVAQRLLDAGLAQERRFGAEAFWDVTARGQSVLSEQETPVVEADRLAIVAQRVLEPEWVGERRNRDGWRRPVPAEILSALLLAKGPLTVRELEHETCYATNYVEGGVQLLSANRFLREETSAGDDMPTADLRYAINEGSWCTIGIRVRPDILLGVVTNLRGEVLSRKRRGLSSTDPDTLADEIARLTRTLRTPDGPILPERLIGLGVELGGFVDSRSGDVLTSPNLSWVNRVPLGELIRTRTGIAAVVIENDVTALAISQQLFGSLGEETSNFAVIMVADGVGAGLVVDGDVLHGGFGLAGELGHLIHEVDGRECRCGRRGCVEAYASAPAILKASAEGRDDGPDTLEEAAARAAGGDETAQDAFRQAGTALGRVVAVLANLVNPAEILIAVPAPLAATASDGRSVAGPAGMFGDALRASETLHALPTALEERKLRIEHVSDLDDYGAQGAAAALLRRFIERPLQWRGVPTSLARSAQLDSPLGVSSPSQPAKQLANRGEAEVAGLGAVQLKPPLIDTVAPRLAEAVAKIVTV